MIKGKESTESYAFVSFSLHILFFLQLKREECPFEKFKRKYYFFDVILGTKTKTFPKCFEIDSTFNKFQSTRISKGTASYYSKQK